MNYGLIKNLILLCLLVFSILNIFFGFLWGHETFYLQLIVGAIYLVFAVLEFLQLFSKKALPSERYKYLPNGLIALKTIKLVAFSVGAFAIYMMGTRLMQLSGLIAIIVISELLIFILRLLTKEYFISFEGNKLLWMQEESEKVFAKTIDCIEYRYNIFYLKTKSKKVKVIEIEKLPEKLQQNFIERFKNWANSNEVPFSAEAKEKLF